MKAFRVKRCPQCGGTDVNLEAGGIMGTYECARCGYRGPLVIEEDAPRPGEKEEPGPRGA